MKIPFDIERGNFFKEGCYGHGALPKDLRWYQVRTARVIVGGEKEKPTSRHRLWFYTHFGATFFDWAWL